MEEKLRMYKEKERFVEALSGVFQTTKHNSSVEGISYEVYTKKFNDRISETREWVVVYYSGGGKAMKIVSGNSNVANFVVIGSMLHGGCYEQVRMYEEQLTTGYERLEL
jgi:rRNA pseudouridine-1189 N-methylase Emg1 (Nep1/Mra1 family)